MNHSASLRRKAQRGKDRDPLLYRMHRRWSFPLTRMLLATPVQPDHVTLAMMLVGIAGTVCLAEPGVAFGVAGVLLLYGAFLLDKVDGELARCRGTVSMRGILLDRFHHRLVEPALFAAAGLHASRQEGSPRALIAAAACMLLANIIEENQHLAPYILFKHLRDGGAPQPPARGRAWTERVRGWLRPAKALRLHIVALPFIAASYVLEAALPAPWTSYYLTATAVLLALVLAFQCVDYATGKLSAEIQQVQAVFELSTEWLPSPEHRAASRPAAASRDPRERPRRRAGNRIPDQEATTPS